MKMRAYFIEDNETIREHLIDTLEGLSCVQLVGTADTEEEGADWLSRNSSDWDLAIVDLFLKQGTGLGIVKACRYRNPEQKMVVLSNHVSREIRSRCAQLGVDAVFDKSTELEALMQYCVSASEKLERPDGRGAALPNPRSLH
ncbi:MAG TPA: response regulator [Polaromonas sp.]|uniref:response regulator n=1 Tax=Polaromonas sp. TaxID=1869339 RepID=UPI002D6281D2|nr:response regulator [Polaromonas sp.]HYW57291.1 response regulator [Polaromonas sp.]